MHTKSDEANVVATFFAGGLRSAFRGTKGSIGATAFPQTEHRSEQGSLPLPTRVRHDHLDVVVPSTEKPSRQISSQLHACTFLVVGVGLQNV